VKALVVFHDGLGGRQHWLAPLLKPGFKHVFVALLNGNYWIRVDGCRGIPEVEVVCGADYDLAGFYRGKGYTVIETEQGQAPVLAPLVHNNCVGLAKVALCLKSMALTPYGLYRYLERKQHEASRIRRQPAQTARGPTAAPAACPDPGA
jgi:hypothetical protein